MIDLLDNIIPSTLDIYDNLFKENRFDNYYDTIFWLWMINILPVQDIRKEDQHDFIIIFSIKSCHNHP